MHVSCLIVIDQRMLIPNGKKRLNQVPSYFPFFTDVTEAIMLLANLKTVKVLFYQLFSTLWIG